MKKSICAVVLFSIFSVLSVYAGPKAELKLMSYNIRYINAKGDVGDLAWDARKESSVTMIHRENPDVIGFQEPRKPQVEYLVEKLPEYGHVELGRDHGDKPDGGEHLMVMWLKDKYDLLDSGTYWLSETPDVLSKGWDAMCRRVTVWVKLRDKATGRELFFFDTHLDHKGEVARVEASKLNVAKMKEIAGGRATVIISGDMNAAFGEANGACLGEYTAWMKSARDTAPVTDSKATYNAFGKEKTLHIDHIFYRNAKALVYETLDGEDYGVRYISDHYPIVCTFKF